MGRSQKKKESDPYEALHRLMRKRLARDDAWFTVNKRYPYDETSLPGDDRAAALVVAAVLEQMLEEAITTHFVCQEDEIKKLFDDRIEGILSTFAAKIAIGNALGIFDTRMRDELRWIKDIRNAFAHTRAELNFDTEEIANACNSLTIPQRPSFFNILSYRSSKYKFMATAQAMYAYLKQEGIRLSFKDPQLSQLYEWIFAPFP